MNNLDVKKIRETLGLTQEELGQKIGVSRNTIINYEKGGVIPESKRTILNNLIDDKQTLFNSDAKPIVDVNFMLVPVVPVSAQASYPKGFGDQEYMDSLPTMPVIVDRNYKGKYMVFEVEGDSMYDGTLSSLCDGDKILCREVKRELWTSKLHIKDWYFVIVCKNDGVTVKQITRHDVENGIIHCHPLNSLFEDFELNLNDVAEIYNVIKIVDRNARI